MNLEIVSVVFENKRSPGEYTGREYSYSTAIPLVVGDIVSVPTQKGEGKAKVVKVGVVESELTFDITLLKTIERLATKENIWEVNKVPVPTF